MFPTNFSSRWTKTYSTRVVDLVLRASNSSLVDQMSVTRVFVSALEKSLKVRL